MKVENSTSETITISGVAGLDIITAVFQDIEKGEGRLIIQCYGIAWAAYWGGMGDRTIQEFILSCDTEYLTDKLWRQTEKRTKRGEEYLSRIIKTVQQAIIIQKT